jgi:hypothetical protein
MTAADLFFRDYQLLIIRKKRKMLFRARRDRQSWSADTADWQSVARRDSIRGVLSQSQRVAWREQAS